MKEPEVVKTIAIHHFLSYEIVFQLIQKKLKVDHTHIHNGSKIW